MNAFHAATAGLLPLTLVGWTLQGESQPARSIRALRHETAEGVTRLILEADGPVRYDYFSPDPANAVVEIPGVEATALPSPLELATPEIRAVRIAETTDEEGRRGLRVEVALTGPLFHQIVPLGHALILVFSRPPEPAGDEPPPDLPPVPATSAPEAAPAVVSSESREEAPQPGATKVVAPLASRLTGVSVADQHGQVAIVVSANGRLQREEFFVQAPDRLVLDFFDVVNAAPQSRLRIGQGAVLAVRVAQHRARPSPITRLVVDLASKISYSIVERADGLTILLGEPGNAQ